MDQHLQRLFGIFLGAFAAVGCASARPPSAASSAATSAPSLSGFLDGPARRVRSRTLDFPIELMLPGKERWQIAEGPSWLVAQHSPSASELALRTWRADRLVQRAECAAQARLSRPAIPALHDETLVERRALSAPANFDSELVVGVEPNARGLSGYALVVGASVGRCYAAVFTTTVSGKDAELEVAARLGLVVDRVLSRVRVRSVDERAPRRHLVVTPKASPE